MHDWTLRTIEYVWESSSVTVALRRWSRARGAPEDVQLFAGGVVDLLVPRRNEWGPSVSVLECDGPSETADGYQRLVLQMQSGDRLTIIARTFEMPPEQT